METNFDKLYEDTTRDLLLITKKCFFDKNGRLLSQKPSSSLAILLATNFDLWGAILEKRFGKSGCTECNVKFILKNLYKADSEKYKDIFDKDGKIKDDVVRMFRHNLVHNFGRGKGNPDIRCVGASFIFEKGRWRINCLQLKNDFLKFLKKVKENNWIINEEK